ncbi:MAG: CapA family protein [Lachnospiraceae bacterium]|nr:CapA family protein [Lachnospiraceae bacterium]
MKNTKTKKVIMITAAVIILIAVVVYMITASSQPYSGAEWKEKEISLNDRTIMLRNKKISIKEKGKATWNSPKEYKVEDVLMADIDSDGSEEMTVLLWKRGKYGNSKPLWEKDKKEDKFWSQHIFIYEINEKGEAVSKWFASDLGMQVKRMAYTGDKKPILLTEDTKGNSSAWIWASWGMTNVENNVSFVVYGDNIIHKEMLENAAGYDRLYEDVKTKISEADIAALNAETVLVDKESAVSGYPQFGSPIAVGEALRDAGFSLICCANNHAMDKGIYGIDTTADFYEANDMTYVGIQKSSEKEYVPYKIINCHGSSFAVFAYTEHTNGFDPRDKYPYVVHYFPEEEKLREEIKKGKEAADAVLVFAHWGEEYEAEPNEYQKKTAQILADAGADVVIGSHPHVVQKTEVIKGEKGNDTLVCYSLGNFRAMPGKDERSKTGCRLEFTFERGIDGVSMKSYETEEIPVLH